MIKKLNTIYVDDDPRSIALFEKIASEVDNIFIEETFRNAADAYKYIKNKNNVDIVFADIEMPDKDGIWLGKQLINENCSFIFVTGYSGYAIDAFEICAIDYLLKPITPTKLRNAIERYHVRQNKVKLYDQMTELKQYLSRGTAYPTRLFISIIGKIVIVQLSEVLYFSASNTYTKIKIKNEGLISSKALGTYAKALENHPDFVRIHRSYIVNKNFTKYLNRDPAKFSITMIDGTTLEISQGRKNEVFERLTQ